MATHIVKKGETLEALAQKFSIPDPMRLKAFHNRYCELDELIDGSVKSGIILHVPEPDAVTEDPEEKAPCDRRNRSIRRKERSISGGNEKRKKRRQEKKSADRKQLKRTRQEILCCTKRDVPMQPRL